MGIEGTCDDRFSAVREAFEANFAPATTTHLRRRRVGGVTIDGELVVDLWGGTADGRRAERCRGSGTRSSTSGRRPRRWPRCACLILADRGELDLHAPVATYWPEFAADGKERHRGPPPDEPHRRAVGLAGADHDGRPLRLGEGRPRCSPPRRRGGSRARRRATTPSPRATSWARSCGGSPGRSLGDVLRRGDRRAARRRLPHRHRAPSTTPASPTSSRRRAAADADGRRPDSVAMRTFEQPAARRRRSSATTPWRRAEIPAAGGHGNARSVALVPHPDGVRRRGRRRAPAVARTASTPCSTSRATASTSCSASPLRHGIGFGLPQPGDADQPERRARASGAAGAARWRSSTSTPG